MTDLSLTYLDTNIKLMINDFQTFRKYFLLQNGNNWDWLGQPNGFQSWVQRKLVHILNVTRSMINWQFDSLLDIGSGVSLFAIAAKQLNPNLKIYLVDYNDIHFDSDFKFYNDSPTAGYYNSWSVVEDLINSNGLDRRDFVFLDPTDAWPDSVDFVRSRASWCWHYPFETYWYQVQQLLRDKGQLWVDIYWREDLDVVETINNFIGHQPRSVQLMHKNIIKNRFNQIRPLQQAHVIGDYFAGSYSWIKSM